MHFGRILDENSQVPEISAGPGTLTIPLATKVELGLLWSNHQRWQMKDLEKQLEKMEDASRGYCVVIQPAGRDDMVKEIWTGITGERYGGEFDPDADYFAYLILRQLGRIVDVRIMNYGAELDFEQEVRYIASFIGKYVEVNHRTKEMIEQYLSSKGLYRAIRSAVVMVGASLRDESQRAWIFIQNLIFVGSTICTPNTQLTGCRHTLAVDSKNPRLCSDIYRLLNGLMRECGTGMGREWGNLSYTSPGDMLQIRTKWYRRLKTMRKSNRWTSWRTYNN